MSQPNGRPELQRGLPQVPPTLATVAQEAGVSRQTVSNALNNPDLLRPETLERVQSVIERLGYSPNRAARQLRTRSSHLIGLRFEAAPEGTTNALKDRFLHSLVEAASRTGHHVLLFSGDPDDPLDGYDDLLRSTAVDAFVVTDTYAGTPQSGFLKERGAPFVTFGRPWDEPDADHAWIDVDGAARCSHRDRAPAGAGTQAGRLARLGEVLAHRPGPAPGLGDGDARGRCGDAPGSAYGSRTTSTPPGWRPTSCCRTRRSPASRAPATSSPSARCTRARSEGSQPGRDVGVVGFDDSPAAAVSWPGLSSVRPPLEQVAVELVQILHTVLAHKPLTDKGRMLQPELVVRRSSRRWG